MKKTLSKYELIVAVATLLSLYLIISVILEFAEIANTLVYFSSTIWFWTPLLALILGMIGIINKSVRKSISTPTVIINGLWVALTMLASCAVGALP